MPADIGVEPPLAKVVETHPKLFGNIETHLELEDDDLLREIIFNTREALVQKYPHAKTTIDRVLELGYGPFMLEPATLLGPEKPSFRERELSARIQHNLAHSILFAASPLAREDYTERINKLVCTGVVKSLQERHGVGKFWAGVRNEAGVIKCLKDIGYQVYIPDYTQDPSKVPLEAREVLQWDVHGGVDVVALNGYGSAILIDAKGDAKSGLDNVYVVKKPAGAIPEILSQFLQSSGINQSDRATIWLPAPQEAFMPDEEREGHDPKSILAHWIKVTPDVRRKTERALFSTIRQVA